MIRHAEAAVGRVATAVMVVEPTLEVETTDVTALRNCCISWPMSYVEG